MADELRFDGRVAIVTGAGGGLGRTHALLLASRGAKVVVNDLGGSMHGGGQSATPAEKVVAEIKEAGGEAIANADSVEHGDKIVQAAMDAFGRIDIVVNNAGILRDVSFPKMTDEDWELIYKVHVLGSYKVTKAAWPHMREAGYGRVIFTASAAGIYGNFGQANYAMAKLGLVGFSNTLALEGKKKNIFVNTIAPIAGSRLTETILPKELLDALKPEAVSPLVAYLAHESCEETGGLFEVGGGFVAKLRWERAEGKSYPKGKPFTPETVKRDFGKITSFEATSHPLTVAESMQPVLDNVHKESKGGNEFIDVDAALGYQFPPMETSYDERDLALYALSVGAAENPLDQSDLKFVYEMHPDGFQAVPTFAVTPVIKGILERAKQGEQAPGLNYGFERILHGEQYTEVRRPLPPNQKLTHKSLVKDIFDKGKHAVVVIETRTYDEKGRELFLNEISMLVRGAGGWGGDRGAAGEANLPPSRDPDEVIEQKISDNQALLYRLTGDWNPLHADPSFAKNFGFERPILHGLCTFGYAARHAIAAFGDNDARRFKSIRARFSDTVFPGETLCTEMWKENGKIIVRCKVKERNALVLNHGAIVFYDEIPKEEAPKQAASSAPAATQSAEIGSADIFGGIGFYVEQHPELVKQTNTSFQFMLKNPDSAWVIDLKTAPGAVKQEKASNADVTLELTDADFIAMSKGELNPQKMYFGGKLKISGNVMASQKLEFLQKVDTKKVQEEMRKAGRLPAAAGAAAPATGGDAPAGDGSFTSADIFVAIRDYIEKNPDLIKQVGTVFQFKLTSPDSAWLIDVKNGQGAVTPGEGDNDVTLVLAESDFMDMTSGKADPQKLYFGGKLKITGNVMASQKLMFLKKVDPESAKAAIAKTRASGEGAGAAAASTSAKKTLGEAFEAGIKKRLSDNPGLAAEVGAVVQITITDPPRVVALDLASSPPAVQSGAAKAPAASLKLADEDLQALAAGSAEELHQRGKLRIDGDMRIATKLGFLKGVLS